MPSLLGRRIAALLEERSMTQKELAGSAGLTEAAVSRYISGKREPRPAAVAAMADALGVAPQDLTGDGPVRRIDAAVLLVSCNAGRLSEEQRAELIGALAKR